MSACTTTTTTSTGTLPSCLVACETHTASLSSSPPDACGARGCRAGYEPPAAASASGALPPGSSFGDCLVEVAHEGCGWLHGLAWAGQGPAADLAYTSHDRAVGSVSGPQVRAARPPARPPTSRLHCITHHLQA